MAFKGGLPNQASEPTNFAAHSCIKHFQYDASSLHHHRHLQFVGICTTHAVLSNTQSCRKSHNDWPIPNPLNISVATDGGEITVTVYES